METWVSYAFAWLATVSLILLASRLRRRKLNPPPGPKPWPIIGNLNLIGELPHRSLHALSQKYGPLMQVQFGSFPVVVGSSVEMAKTILKTHDVIFSGRPKTAAGKYTTYNYSDITWSPYGPYWRQARKMCLMELFSAKRLESYEYIRVEELKALLKTLHKSSGRPINLKDHLTDVSLNVISRMVLGKKYTVKSSENEKEIVTPEEFKEMLDELFLLNGVLDIGDSIPWIAFLDLQGYIKRMKVLSKKFDKFMEHVLDEHESRRKREDKNWEPKDMVDVLLQLASDPNLEVKLERHGVKAFSQRFIGNSIDVRGHDYELLPFGAGRRMCPGYPLGLKVIQATLSNLLHGFKWRLPDGVRKEELSMEEIFGLSTPKKYPLVAVAEPRLPAHVYPKRLAGILQQQISQHGAEK
ncbi:hypothetical protein POTOM_004923 [Populus tomentosa]|uniref:Uncharacterized protein n=1 Tax=Populus tomentosa TaxID=118781 RepID=A0A8X8AVZ2_POPTO|nr:hypothetical protein POTOM_004923 [Populus tomentosa]